MTVVATLPEADGVLPADAPVTLRLSHHLAPGAALSSRVSLATGEEGVSLTAGYDPVDRALVVVPNGDLRVGRPYTLTLTAQGLVSVDGRPLAEDLTLDFLAGSPTGGPRARPRVDYTADVDPLFAGRCGCHRLGQADPPLTPERLVGQPSARDPARTLVVPGEPLQSLLVQKILRDWPGTPGEPMPPLGALTAEEQRVLVGWVEGLRP